MFAVFLATKEPPKLTNGRASSPAGPEWGAACRGCPLQEKMLAKSHFEIRGARANLLVTCDCPSEEKQTYIPSVFLVTRLLAILGLTSLPP